MHILFVTDGDAKYGTFQGLKQTVVGLRKYYPNIKISLIMQKGILRRNKAMIRQRADLFRNLGINVYQIQYGAIHIRENTSIARKIIAYVKYYFGLLFGARIVGHKIEMNEIDLVHSNSNREDFGATIAERYHKPLVWHIREFEDLDFHATYIRKNIIDYMNQSAQLLLCVSETLRKHWINKGIDANKAKAIYDGVDEFIIPKTDYAHVQNNNLRFVMLGAVDEAKGQHQLVEALGKISKEKLGLINVDIVGDFIFPQYADYLNNRIKELDLANVVHLLGYQENFREHLYEYDCGIMCSRAEAFGFVTLEYMSAGLPVIASDTGANPEIIIDGKVGFLYETENPFKLAEKIEIFLDSPELCEQMGHNAAEYVRERFPLRKYIDNIVHEYERLILEYNT